MKRTSALPATLLAVAITFGLAACGDDANDSASESTSADTASETTAPSETTEPAATTEPSATTDAPGSTVPADGPTVESATEVVDGLTLEDATAAAEEQGWILRVTREDDSDLPATMDFRPNRVNVEVTDGDVTAVLNIG